MIIPHMLGKKELKWCNVCKERSVRVKVYSMCVGGVSERRRVEYCINSGCGYKQMLPNLIQTDREVGSEKFVCRVY